MAKDDAERYTKALAHVRSVNGGLADDVAEKILAQGKKTEVIGAELSLGGSGYWNTGSAEQHVAVRALLLCQIAYFRPPHAWGDMANADVLKLTRTKLHGKTIAEVDEEIGYYAVGNHMALDDLAAASQTICDANDGPNELWRNSGDTRLSKMTICYTGVSVWLFASRFVSRRWLVKKLDANTANALIGKGIEVPPNEWANIPRGWIWNVQRRGDPTTCHWGISLGKGLAAATNNTSASPFATLNYLSAVDTDAYGTFNFSELCDVLNGTVKYGHTGNAKPKADQFNIAVYKINPLGNANFY